MKAWRIKKVAQIDTKKMVAQIRQLHEIGTRRSERRCRRRVIPGNGCVFPKRFKARRQWAAVRERSPMTSMGAIANYVLILGIL
ncbi:MAG: hypothetical protein PVF97_09860, partial [Desulfobacterales bacterium]